MAKCAQLVGLGGKTLRRLRLTRPPGGMAFTFLLDCVDAVRAPSCGCGVRGSSKRDWNNPTPSRVARCVQYGGRPWWLAQPHPCVRSPRTRIAAGPVACVLAASATLGYCRTGQPSCARVVVPQPYTHRTYRQCQSGLVPGGSRCRLFLGWLPFRHLARSCRCRSLSLELSERLPLLLTGEHCDVAVLLVPVEVKLSRLLPLSQEP